jgi:hypothetical protein
MMGCGVRIEHKTKYPPKCGGHLLAPEGQCTRKRIHFWTPVSHLLDCTCGGFSLIRKCGGPVAGGETYSLRPTESFLLHPCPVNLIKASLESLFSRSTSALRIAVLPTRF